MSDTSSIPIPSFESNEELKALTTLLTLLLRINGISTEDCERLRILVQTAFTAGYIAGMKSIVEKIETAALKTLDNQPPAQVN